MFSFKRASKIDVHYGRKRSRGENGKELFQRNKQMTVLSKRPPRDPRGPLALNKKLPRKVSYRRVNPPGRLGFGNLSELPALHRPCHKSEILRDCLLFDFLRGIEEIKDLCKTEHFWSNTGKLCTMCTFF